MPQQTKAQWVDHKAASAIDLKSAESVDQMAAGMVGSDKLSSVTGQATALYVTGQRIKNRRQTMNTYKAGRALMGRATDQMIALIVDRVNRMKTVDDQPMKVIDEAMRYTPEAERVDVLRWLAECTRLAVDRL